MSMLLQTLSKMLFAVVVFVACGSVRAAEPDKTTHSPWAALGRINAKGMSFCTGAMIGPETVLTAAHCVYNFKAKRWRLPREIYFVAGYYRGEYVAASRAKRIQRAANFTPVTKGITLAHIQKDWAIVTLEKPIGRQTGWYAVDTQQHDLRKALVIQAGYSRKRPHIAELSPPCRVVATMRHSILVHDCVVPKGGSGSPMFIAVGNQIKIAGVHSAQMAGQKTATRGTAVIPLWSFMAGAKEYPEPDAHEYLALSRSIRTTLEPKGGVGHSVEQVFQSTYAAHKTKARYPLFH